MKKVSLAAFLASALLLNTPVAQADSTVKGQKAATPAAAAAVPGAATAGGHHSPSAELIARPGNKRSIFELDFMVPIYQLLDRMLFADLRGLLDTRRNKEINFGLGYRQIVQNSFVLGAYVYGDWRRTRHGNNFWQVTLGGEALSIANLFDIRVNGYLPEKKRKGTGSGAGTATIVGNNIQLTGRAEGALPGFDGEVGVRIPMPGMNQVEARIFAGGYYFSRSGAPKVAGPRGRLEVRIYDIINPGSRLTLGVDVMNDKVRKTNVYGFIGIRVPMQFMGGGKAPQGLQRRLGDYVYRDVDIVSVQQTVNNGYLQNAAGQSVRVWVAKATGSNNSGNGTLTSPYGSLDQAIAKATQPGDIAYAQGNANKTPLPTNAAGLIQTNNVNVWGDGIIWSVSQNGNTYVVQNAGGNVPTPVSGVATGNTIDITTGGTGFTGTNVQGLNVTTGNNNGAAVYGNFGSGAANVYIANNTFNGGGATAGPGAIQLNAGNGSNLTATVQNNSATGFSATGSAAFNYAATGTGSTINVTSSGNTLGAATGTSNYIGVKATSQIATGGTVTFIDTSGIYTNNAIAIQGGAATGTPGAGTINLTINNPAITSNVSSAYGVLAGNQAAGTAATVVNVQINGGSIAMTGSGNPAGILFTTSGQNFTGSSASFSVTGTTFTGNGLATGTNGSNGILVNPDGTVGTVGVTVTDCKFRSNAGDDGIGADLHFSEVGANTALNVSLSGNAFNSPADLANTTGSILFTKQTENANVPINITMTGNTLTGATGNAGSGIYFNTAAVDVPTTSVTTLNMTGNTIKGFATGSTQPNGLAAAISFLDGSATAGAGVFLINLTSGNLVTGNGIGLQRSDSDPTNITINGQTVSANIFTAISSQVTGNGSPATSTQANNLPN